MKVAPIPSFESERLDALRRYQILDSDAEKAYDDLAELASVICGTPVALVSLVDADRQWFKARVGLDVEEPSRDVAFCAHAILGEDLLVVPDATRDDRFADNPLVTGAPGVRFYAGAPLITPDGYGLGTLCVVDSQPHELTDEQARALRMLSRQVMALLEYRRTARDLAHALERVRQLQELLPICAYCKKIRDDDGYWRNVEEYIREHAGSEFTHGICPDCIARHFPEALANADDEAETRQT
ncbi:MAG: GAF domain-containing protein [Verrucomicrobia bacterium]|nr:MAG: GAF domain-containing protein [Verrucomicrobiota bacterium]